jgi:hypothetical protein
MACNAMSLNRAAARFLAAIFDSLHFLDFMNRGFWLMLVHEAGVMATILLNRIAPRVFSIIFSFNLLGTEAWSFCCALAIDTAIAALFWVVRHR